MAKKTEVTTPEGRPTDGTDRQTIMFQVSPEFFQAIDTFSAKLGLSRSEAIRQMVAQAIEYALSDEPKRARPHKYANEAERKAATLARAKARRQLTAKLLEAYNSEDRDEAIKALLASTNE